MYKEREEGTEELVKKGREERMREGLVEGSREWEKVGGR